MATGEKTERLLCLDGLRGVLAFYVLLGHLAPFALLPRWLADAVSHGGAAVDVFFILSGMVILRSLDAFGYVPAPFLRARVLRIFPVFLVVFLLAVAVQPFETGFARLPWLAPESLARELWSDGWPSDWLAGIAAHLTMTHGLFPDGPAPFLWVGFLGSAWSLSDEWQFYIVAVLLARPGREWQVAFVLLGLAAGAVVWAHLAPEPWRFSRAFFPNKAHLFALGIASAGLLREGFAPTIRHRRFAAVLAATLLLCLAGGAGKLAAPLIWTACLAAQIVPHAALRPAAWSLGTRPLVWLGAVSYALYLVNEPVLKLLTIGLGALAGGDGALFTALWLPLSIGLSLAGAWWLHRAIEQPALRWGRRRRRPPHSALNSPSPGPISSLG